MTLWHLVDVTMLMVHPRVFMCGQSHTCSPFASCSSELACMIRNPEKLTKAAQVKQVYADQAQPGLTLFMTS